MRIHPTARLLVLATMTVLTTGCSVLLLERPAQGEDKVVSPHCSSRYLAPVLDLVFAGLAIHAAVNYPEDEVADFSGLFYGGGVVFGVSSIIGFTVAPSCRS